MPASRLVTLLNERLWLRIFRFFSKQLFYRTTVYGCFRIIRIWLQKYKQGSVLKREFFIEKWVFLVCWYPVTLFEKDSLVGVLLKILRNFFITFLSEHLRETVFTYMNSTVKALHWSAELDWVQPTKDLSTH